MSNRRAIDEAKKGSAEILILAVVEDEGHHGYEIAKLIEQRLGVGPQAQQIMPSLSS